MSGAFIRDGRSMNNSLLSESNQTSGKSKLTDDQTLERLELHAQRIAYGKPSFDGICKHWMDKYSISMHPSSEREWYSVHSAEVDTKINEMAKDGRLELIVSSTPSLSLAVEKSSRNNSELLNVTKNNLKMMLDHVSMDIKGKKETGLSEDDLASIERKVAIAEKMLEIHKKQSLIQNTVIEQALKIQRQLDGVAHDLNSKSIKKRKKNEQEVEFAEAEIIDDLEGARKAFGYDK